jgi:hypothetical protein
VIQLIAGDRKFNLHTAPLKRKSPYFKALIEKANGDGKRMIELPTHDTSLF